MSVKRLVVSIMLTIGFTVHAIIFWVVAFAPIAIAVDVPDQTWEILCLMSAPALGMLLGAFMVWLWSGE